MADDWGLLDKDGDAEACCSECENVLDWVECNECDGDGMGDHDCGEDCCPCLDPEPNTLCPQCGGAGGWYWCWTCKRID